MVIGIQIVLLAAVVALSLWVFGRSLGSALRGLAVGVVANAVTFYGMVFFLGNVGIYGAMPSWTVLLSYVVSVAMLSALLLGALAFAYKRRGLEKRGERKILGMILFSVGGALVGFLTGLLFFIPKWFNETLGDIPADHFVFLLTQGNGSSTVQQDLEVLNKMVVPVIFLTLLGALIGFIRSDVVFFSRKDDDEVFRFRYLRGTSMLVMVALMVGAVPYAFAKVPLAGVLRQSYVHSDYIEGNFVFANDKNVRLPEKKRNLIHIYMESIENSYYSSDLGGYSRDNLMPELAALSDTGVSFSDNTKHGGPQQTYASGHSVAAMVNMWAGTPMLSSGAGDGSQMSFPDFPTIGDILHKHGYATTYMVGSDSSWGGTGEYYRRHGKFKVEDTPYFKKQGYIPDDYHVWWGVEDDKLYEYAKKSLTQLGEGKDPFYFILENADTHFPRGYVSKNMTDAPFAQQYANVIHYSQREVVKLVEWIKAQSWSDNTTIVITGDHLSMDGEFFEGWDPAYNRTIVNMILNPVPGLDTSDKITKNRQYAPFDFFPTILSSIGAQVNGGQLGLGTDLFSGKPTLLERRGKDLIDQEFSKKSTFYDSHRETKAKTSGPQ
ncbi:LTA synthase family protein [Arcanobacterium haemolyticum]|uniref:Sulfatase n=1 Tax=Arcanobacterium haemolyticum (strain ATCC 9345 / DSM 20595 / CCM 5947 / CCUG 17215 / LMG 16163 / NBRC 15585 / NCTC 8452 / 11018) TaxID=644284 RepID=D7BLI0_ARCHD|nr:LTA synthase family protein [Arcanobacterium haemolyticum]ADH91779.1 sulfatase [Arcanobacterium haemolyticum DSM 20595]SQH27424.1 Lipoteichoic acid synthase [Arcanobacterium haemolyticum]